MNTEKSAFTWKQLYFQWKLLSVALNKEVTYSVITQAWTEQPQWYHYISIFYIHVEYGHGWKFYLFKQISGFLCEVGRQVEFTLENLVNCFLSVLPSERRLESTSETGGKTRLVQISYLCTQNSLQSFTKQVKLLQIGTVWIQAALACSQHNLRAVFWLFLICSVYRYNICIYTCSWVGVQGSRKATKGNKYMQL